MNLIYAGTDYRCSSLKELEQLVLTPGQIRDFINTLPSDSPIGEIAILSTCNRIEFYMTANSVASTIDWLQAYLADYLTVDITLTRSMTFKDGIEAIVHLFRVSSGLESMVFGENEILSQVKECYAIAKDVGRTGPVLNKVFQGAVAAGKRARSETSLGRGSYSISSIAIEGIRDAFPKYQDKSILVVGGGTMARRVIKKLAALGHEKIAISNRTENKVAPFRDNYNAMIVPFSEWKSKVSLFNIILFATASPVYLFDDKCITNITDVPELVIDLGLPRNVNPILAGRKNIRLIALKEIEFIADKTVTHRKRELPKIEFIISDEICKFQKWQEFRHNPGLSNCA